MKKKAPVESLRSSDHNPSPRLRVLHSRVNEHQALPQKQIHKRLALHTSGGVCVLDLSDVFYIKAEGNYASVFTSGNQAHLISKTLRHFENRLGDHGFIRVHQSYLVNAQHIHLFSTADGYEIILKNKSRVPVSRRQAPAIKEYLLKQFI